MFSVAVLSIIYRLYYNFDNLIKLLVLWKLSMCIFLYFKCLAELQASRSINMQQLQQHNRSVGLFVCHQHFCIKQLRLHEGETGS